MIGRNKKIAYALSELTERTAKWLSPVGLVDSHWVSSAHTGSVGSGHVELVGSCGVQSVMRAPLPWSADWSAGPGDGPMSLSPRVMNRRCVCLYIYAIHHLGCQPFVILVNHFILPIYFGLEWLLKIEKWLTFLSAIF
jgi:hypothetical protein